MQAIRQGQAAAQANQWLHLELERREMLMLADARGQTLECRSGELWLTEDGQGDQILCPGESYVVSGNGCLVVSACQDVRFALGGRGDPAQIYLQPVRGFLASLVPHELSGLMGLGGRSLA
ncbi:MAG TPA: DUF2917 domain-containing protein [Azospira sp.]|nr:DUF2917 domain-containing protein [Azospira sp.]